MGDLSKLVTTKDANHQRNPALYEIAEKIDILTPVLRPETLQKLQDILSDQSDNMCIAQWIFCDIFTKGRF